MKGIDSRLARKNIDEFAEMFQLPIQLKRFYSYGPLQKKLLKLALQFYLDGGSPMNSDSEYPKLGNLTNDNIARMGMWKQDPHGIDIDDSVQRAVQDFGQDVQELNRGIGKAQYDNILNKISSGQKIFNLSRTQSFSRDYRTAAEFASNGGGSIHDTNHGSGGVITIVNTRRKPMFFLDEFNFYSSLADIYFRKIVKSTDMTNVIDSIDFDDVFESAIFEDEWLVPTTYKFNFIEAVDGDCENKDLIFDIL